MIHVQALDWNIWEELIPPEQLETTASFVRQQELKLRKQLYCWENFRDDRVVDDVIACPIVVCGDIVAAGFGIEKDIKRPENPSGAHAYHSVIVSEEDIDSVEFVKLAGDENLIRELGIDNDTLEGYLYPDTYFVRHGTEPHEMITRMVGKFKQVFGDSLVKRASEIGMSVNEVVILASIIETEAGRKEERPLVSSVFHRRLKRGRPLEANPTIQYALGNKRRVLLEDLDIDSPYNTYTNPGLPPAPIASPGRESIIAALYPADTKYLYFMANGKGGHVFSKTLKEHNRAVSQYKRFRKQVNKN